MDELMLRSGAGLVTVAADGSYRLELPGFGFDRVRARMVLDGKDEVELAWHFADRSAEHLALACENAVGNWRLEFRAVENGFTLRFTGRLRKLCREISLIPFEVAAMPLDHFLGQGVTMGRCQIAAFPSCRRDDFEAHFTAMLTRAGQHVLVSLPLRQRIISSFAGKFAENGVGNFQVVQRMSHEDRLELESDPVSLIAGRDPFALTTAWAEANTEVVKDFSSAVLPGWNSWDYYRWTITEKEVLENAEFIARDPVLSKKIKRIIVDDGWQYCYGEWTANSLFPNGMKYLADELTRMGFEPGLWFAPTIVEPHCRIAQTGYDMLALSEGGQPCLCYECMRRVGFVLDPTLPKVQKHLFDLFRDYVGMGYKYFKLDFMGSTYKAAQFRDRTVSRAEIARLIVKPAYEALAGRGAVLGCNYFFNGGNRYVDAVRTGSDIHATWEGIRANVGSVAARFYSNRRWWVNDPDFALCRAFDTSDDPDINRLKACYVFVTRDMAFSPECEFELVDIHRPQSEILLSIVLMAAGAINFSDKMTRLNAAGLDLARRMVSAEPGETGIPLDLFAVEHPSYWLQKTASGHRALLINWTDESAVRELNLAPHGISAGSATDLWHDTVYPVEKNQLRFELPPRSCKFLILS